MIYIEATFYNKTHCWCAVRFNQLHQGLQSRFHYKL